MMMLAKRQQLRQHHHRPPMTTPMYLVVVVIGLLMVAGYYWMVADQYRLPPPPPDHHHRHPHHPPPLHRFNGDGAPFGDDDDDDGSPNDDRDSSSLPPFDWRNMRNDPRRWLMIPQGWYDDEPYDDVADHARCKPISPDLAVMTHHMTATNSNNLTASSSLLGDPLMSRPWWYPHLVSNHGCGTYQTMAACHSTNDTCQWTLQGYCINYNFTRSPSQAEQQQPQPLLVWWQYEVLLGGLTNQHWAALRGLMVAQYAQRQLQHDSIIVATLLPRVHRQSVTRGVDKYKGANNHPHEFRPFRHFFDASSISCPHDMGPIIERPRLKLLSSMGAPLRMASWVRDTSMEFNVYRHPWCNSINRTRAHGKEKADKLVHLFRRNARKLRKGGHACSHDDHGDRHERHDYIRGQSDPPDDHPHPHPPPNNPHGHRRPVTTGVSPLVIVPRIFFCNIDSISSYPIREYPLAFAHQWHRIADRVVATMTSSSPTAAAPSSSSPSPSAASSSPQVTTSPMVKFVGLHLRRESDLCEDRGDDEEFSYCQWTPNEWMQCIQRYMRLVRMPNVTNGYIATANEVIDSDWFTPWRSPATSLGHMQWRTKLSAINNRSSSSPAITALATALAAVSFSSSSISLSAPTYDHLLREELGMIDQLVLQRATLFIGIHHSSFSRQIHLNRHLLQYHHYDGIMPRGLSNRVGQRSTIGTTRLDRRASSFLIRPSECQRLADDEIRRANATMNARSLSAQRRTPNANAKNQNNNNMIVDDDPEVDDADDLDDPLFGDLDGSSRDGDDGNQKQSKYRSRSSPPRRRHHHHHHHRHRRQKNNGTRHDHKRRSFKRWINEFVEAL